MNRQAVLGSSHRVQKQRPREVSTSTARALVSSWTAGFPRRKASEPSGNKRAGIDTDADSAAVPARDQTPRNIPQAMVHARDNMFSALPERGISAALAATVLARRASLPPMVSMAHLQALLGWTPTVVERETAELVRAGTLRRVAVPGRGAMGEALVLAADMERMLRDGDGLDGEACDAFARVLREHPTAHAVPAGSLAPSQLGALMRAGFLTGSAGGQSAAGAAGASIFSRPEDRSTLISLAMVARAASGTVGAVGGEGRSREHVLSSGSAAAAAVAGSGIEYRIAIPGAGVGLKLVAAALAHLTELLARLPDREGPEDALRERWDGGAAKAGGGRQTRRGGRVGVTPGRTRRWKDFSGLRFDWVLAEAAGAGLVEVFETGCVGRGVRLVSPS